MTYSVGELFEFFGISLEEHTVLVLCFTSILPVGYVHRPVMVKVAALAEGSQIPKAVILPVPIDMGHCQDHPATGTRVRMAVPGTAPFAPVMSPVHPNHAANE
ncbi:hypothetical protein BUE76_10500 [Cnuella takakiae]|nr:hypothetical protein BUE76_10500 [Cnuella takakiae]